MSLIRIVRQKRAPHSATPLAQPSAKLMRWDAQIDLASQDTKKFDTVKDGDRVVDYQNVTLKGYLSTFKTTTESDRDGDYVDEGAFTETIRKFMKNPVLLVNHRNEVQSLAGSFTVVKEDKRGLYVEAMLSNSQSENMKDVRAKVAEGHLRTLSMGGIFHYKEDGRGIFKVDLWEGSLTPIPANPDAIFSTRELTEHEMKKVQFDIAA